MRFTKKLLFLLSERERLMSCFLLVMFIFNAILDAIGVASILPFMTVVVNPELVKTNEFLDFLYNSLSFLGIDNVDEFIIILGIGVFILLVLSLIFKSYTLYLQLKFVAMREFSIGSRLIKKFLYQPYTWFLQRHSADLGKTVLNEVSLVVGKGLTPLLNIAAYSLIALAMIILLFIFDPKLTLIVTFVLCFIYVLIFMSFRYFLSRIGNERLEANKYRFINVIEAFGAFKEIKVGRLEDHYIKRFSEPAYIYAKHSASSQIISQIPKFFVEIVVFGGLLLILLYILSIKGNFLNSIPIISLYVFAAYRLLPAIQVIYRTLSQIRFIEPAVSKIYNDLINLQPKLINEKVDNPKKLNLNKVLKLKNIFYSYPNTSRTTIKNIDINIPAFSTIGIIGKTGSGKTTIIDLILGLLKPKKGTLNVDDEVINENNLRAWQKSIGYVPQQIFLADDTVISNIALGIDKKDIDFKAIYRAAEIANLHDFVENELPDKYETVVGERGVRLSGGQRQRIGIARALYHNPKILILDEATSSLDNLTEQAVMDEVYKFREKMTVIIVAHRLSTVKRCDNIFLLEKGELINQGKFDELVEKNEHFRSNISNF